MRWKRGLVALLATAVATVLLFAVPAVISPASDNPELAGTPAQTDRLPSPSDPGMVPLPKSHDTAAPDVRPEPKKPRKPKKPDPSFDADAVSALKAALEKSRQTEVKQSRPSSAPPKPPSAPQPRSLDFVLSSFNVLGSSHTAPGGTRARSDFARGPTRMRWASRLIARHGVDVVGFQELQPDQQRTFLRSTRGRFDIYPGLTMGGKGSNNSIAWRRATWELVDAGTIGIPYFNGSRWPMPVVLLRNRETGLSAYFSNFHNPANTKRHPNQGRWRRIALSREIALVNRLMNKTEHPVFLTGDLNQREVAFCAITGRSAMVAANGGSNDGRCRPPAQPLIDWIFGSEDATFSNYQADRSRMVRRTSDHPMVVSDVRIEGRPSRR